MYSCLLQCVLNSALCDKKQQCVDGSDEHRCEPATARETSSQTLPIIVEFQRTGNITIRSLRPGAVNVDVMCPETHFWCLSKNFCLPVFVRCNGVFDCPGHEDEDGCDQYECPGFYRCRASKVCVHVAHVCDDWPVCPQLDDELLCGQSCPQQCTCHGLAFFCPQAFAATDHPDLRYLDAADSGMSAHHIGNNHMLIHLSFARCKVETVSNFTFHNLRSLDLSDNLLTEVSGHHLSLMPQLTHLFLAGNPLIFVFMVSSRSSFRLQTMRTVDLSRVKQPFVVPSLFAVFPGLQALNLSYSGMGLLQWNSSDLPEPALTELDLRGGVITELPQDLLRGFPDLKLLFTDSFKLCCPIVLPLGFDLNHCHTTPDDVSSCDNLLGSVTYRVTVAVLATLALLGNVVSLTVRVCGGSTWRVSNSGVVLTHLSMADLGMGLYLATLALADHLLTGQYVMQDVAWRRGVVCQMAGALALACRHSATLFITILSLDRLFHRFPILHPCLTSAKVKVVCMLVWATSLLLATVPITAQWLFYGTKAVCVPLPHINDDSVESSYAYGVIALFGLALFTMSSVCEVARNLFNKIRISTYTKKDSCNNDIQFVQLCSLASGFLYTIACLVPTNSNDENQMAVHTALIFFGSVVSCAMNPYLDLFGVRLERSKRIKEERLLRIVKRAQV